MRLIQALREKLPQRKRGHTNVMLHHFASLTYLKWWKILGKVKIWNNTARFVLFYLLFKISLDSNHCISLGDQVFHSYKVAGSYSDLSIIVQIKIWGRISPLLWRYENAKKFSTCSFTCKAFSSIKAPWLWKNQKQSFKSFIFYF